MRNQKGQSIVELTLITPLLLAALYVPVDFGMALYTASLSQNAVRDVARVASTKDSSAFNASTLQTDVINRMPSLAVSPSATVIRYTTGTANCMQLVEASVTYTYNYGMYRLANLFGISTPTNSSVTRTARMRYEFQPDSNGPTACTSA